MRLSATTQLCMLALYCRYSYAQETNATLIVSQDGNCGGSTNQTCVNSSFGNCCSGKGYCGGTSDYCNAECQVDFGQCVANASSISTDGRCGSTDSSGQICLGSSFGSCCSETGWCGSTDVYCGTGCQGNFGECNGTSTVVSPSGSQTTSLPTSSSIASSQTSSSVTSATDTAASAVQSPAASTMSSGAKAGVGVGVAAAGVALIGAVMFMVLRRKKQKRSPELNEKIEAGSGSRVEEMSSAASRSSVSGQDAHLDHKDLPPVPLPAELGNQRNSRVELGDDWHDAAVELDSKGGSSQVTELPISKD